MSSIEKCEFGRTGARVSRLGLGTYHLTSDRYVAHDDAVTLVREAIRAGIDVVDTAPMYGLGEAELIVGKALKNSPAPVFLIDKVGRFEKSIVARHSRDAYADPWLIRAQFEHSLRVLGRDRIDLLLLHESDWQEWWQDLSSGTGPAVEVLETLRAEGLIGAMGLSLRKATETVTLCSTGRFDAMLFVHYCNMVWQESVEEVLPAAVKQNMGIAIGAPYRQGLLLGGGAEQAARLRAERRTSVPPGIIDRIQRAETIAANAGMAMPELGLRWLLSQPAVGTVMVGPRSLAELEQNLAWAQMPPLEADLLAAIAELREIPAGEWSES